MSFFSCGKPYTPPPLSEVLPNTVWEGSSYFRIPDTETIREASYQGGIRIVFLKDEASISASYNFHCQYLDSSWNYSTETWDYHWQQNYGKYEVFKGNATYTCKEDDITVKIKWDSEIAENLGGSEWIGAADEYRNSMFLRNVFGDIVTFRKNY